MVRAARMLQIGFMNTLTQTIDVNFAVPVLMALVVLTRLTESIVTAVARISADGAVQLPPALVVHITHAEFMKNNGL